MLQTVPFLHRGVGSKTGQRSRGRVVFIDSLEVPADTERKTYWKVRFCHTYTEYVLMLNKRKLSN